MTYPLALQGPERMTWGGWAGAVAVHGLVAAAFLALPETRAWVQEALPVEVRLLQPEAKPERLPEPPPKRMPPPAVPPPVSSAPPPPPPVLATSAPVPVAMAVPPPPPVPVIATLAPASPRPVPAVVAAPAPPAPEPLVEARFDADYLANPKPAYPMASRRLKETGTVLLRVRVSEDGAPAHVEVKASSGYDRLDDSARDTVTRWRFVPARRGTRSVESWVVVPIVFSLT